MVEPGGGCLPTNLPIHVSRSWRQESDNNTYLLPIQFHYCESQHKCYSHAHTYTRARRTHTHARCILIYKQSQKLSCAHTRAYYKEYIYAGAHTHTHAPRSVRIYTVYITTILGQSALDNIENRQQLIRAHSAMGWCLCKNFLILPTFQLFSVWIKKYLGAIPVPIYYPIFNSVRASVHFCVYVIFRRKCAQFGYICKAAFCHNKALYLFASL